MTLFYPDYSSYQGAAVVPVGTPAIVAKATEGTYDRDADYGYYKTVAQQRNIPFSGYHFLKADIDPAAQALYYWNFAGSTPCMLDVETEGASKPTVDEVLAFITALHGHGGRVWGVYLPQWYWGEVGGDLGRLTAAGAVLVSSNYTTYSDSGPGWNAYGGATPIVWQYTDTPIDMNAFRGTPAQLATLINGATTPPPTEDDMPAFATGTVTPGDSAVTVVCPPPANSGAANWGNVWFSLGSDLDGDNPPTVRVAAWVAGTEWMVKDNVAVPAAGPRVNPFNAPLPKDTEKISIRRENNAGAPMAYLVEAV